MVNIRNSFVLFHSNKTKISSSFRHIFNSGIALFFSKILDSKLSTDAGKYRVMQSGPGFL